MQGKNKILIGGRDDGAGCGAIQGGWRSGEATGPVRVEREREGEIGERREDVYKTNKK